MDGPHDIGGRHGFSGPIDRAGEDKAFKADWEARMWGIANCSTLPPGWTLDWWRHIREAIAPGDYYDRPYLDSWMQTYATLFIDAGWITVEEVIAGKAQGPGPDVPPPLAPGGVRKRANTAWTFDRDANSGPRFAVGDTVRTKELANPHHTRLPQYARGKPGVIFAHRGFHVLPDAAAKGDHSADHLYTVEFRNADLWFEARDSRDTVLIDLWESYFDA